MARKPAKKPVKKKPAATFKSEPKQGSSFFYGFVIVAVLSFAGFIYYLEKNSATDSQISKSTKPQTKPQNDKSATKAKNQTKQSQTSDAASINYEFYGVLPNIEIEVDRPKAKVTNTIRNSKNEPLKIIDNDARVGLYQLQISAFSSEQKAEKLRAELGFMGVQSNISPIKARDKMLYRVRVGPSKDKTNLLRFKKILENKGFKPILQTLNG